MPNFKPMELNVEYFVKIKPNFLIKFPRAGSGVSYTNIKTKETFILPQQFHPFVNPSMDVTIKFPITIPTLVDGVTTTAYIEVENAQSIHAENFFNMHHVTPVIKNGKLMFSLK